jgi:Xaa-Pro aminopeptidase
VLAFDFANIRYMTSTHIGAWAVDKLIRFALLVRGGEPIVWDFGSAAKHHQLYNRWLDYSNAHSDGDPHAAHHGADARNPSGARAGISTLRAPSILWWEWAKASPPRSNVSSSCTACWANRLAWT